ncbi:MAG: hypothetical protein NXI32_24985 [bacterium]|nr:hypothetical protein [bacterium]
MKNRLHKLHQAGKCCLCLGVAVAGLSLSTPTPCAVADEPDNPPAVASEDRDDYDPEARFDLQVREDLFAGFEGDDEALKRGLAKCEETLAKVPDHPEALVWRGAAFVFMSGQSFQKGNQIEGFKYWGQGLADMDKAVELAPDNVAVLIPRAAVLLPAGKSAPPAMGLPLLKQVRKDFERIYQRQEKYLDQLGEHPRGELRMGLADVYRALDEPEKSRQQLEAVVKELPETEYAARAAKWLKAGADVKLSHNCIGCHSE